MKRINLKICTVNNSAVPAGFELNYRREYLQLLEVAPDGVTVSEMAKLIRVIDRLKIAEDSGSILLEDADWQTLRERVEAAKFQFVAAEIVELVENVTNAETVTV